MKRLWPVTLMLVVLFATAAPALASTVLGALYKADITAVNTSYDAQRVSVPFTLSTQSLLDGYYMNTSFTNVALQDGAGADLAFMPAQGAGDQWMMFLPQILQNSALNSILYTGGTAAMNGKLRWFPGDAGMAAADHASLELGNNFEIEAKGYFDTTVGASKNIGAKTGALTSVVSGAGQITTTINTSGAPSIYSSTSDGDISSSDATYATAQAAASGTVTSNGATISVGQAGGGITQTQSTGASVFALYSGSTTRAVERVNGFTGTLTSVGLYLYKINSPTGTATVKVWRVSDDAVLGTLGTKDVATLTGSSALYTFTSPVVIASPTDIRIGIEYSGGSAAHYVRVNYETSDVSAWGFASTYTGSWTDQTGYDLKFSISYTLQSTVTRSYLYFDTSEIPSGSTISSAVLYLYGAADNSTTDFSLTVTNGQPTYPHDPLVGGDFNKTQYSGTGGTLTTAGFSVAGYNALTLDATGRGWINKGGQTKLELASSRDLSVTTPTGDEYVTFYSTDEAGTSKDPYLVVTFTGGVGTSVANGVTSGEHTIKVSLADNTLKTFVDGVEADSDSIGGSIVDNANAWAFTTNYSMPYVEYIKVTVGGVLVGHWYWENATTFTDQSGNSNTATPTFRTVTTDADVSATIKAFTAANASVFSSGDDDAGPEMVTSGDLPPVFAGFYINLHAEDFPGGPSINSFLDDRNVPYTAFWIPLVYFGGAVITMVGYRWTRKLLPAAMAGVIWNIFFGAVIGSGYWGLFVIGVVTVGEMINKKKASY